MDNALLTSTLAVAVPMWVERIQHYTDEQRTARAHELGQVIAEHGDLILYRSKRRGESARNFNALAEGLACLAYAPGGVTFAGSHWEAG